MIHLSFYDCDDSRIERAIREVKNLEEDGYYAGNK